MPIPFTEGEVDNYPVKRNTSDRRGFSVSQVTFSLLAATSFLLARPSIAIASDQESMASIVRQDKPIDQETALSPSRMTEVQRILGLIGGDFIGEKAYADSTLIVGAQPQPALLGDWLNRSGKEFSYRDEAISHVAVPEGMSARLLAANRDQIAIDQVNGYYQGSRLVMAQVRGFILGDPLFVNPETGQNRSTLQNPQDIVTEHANHFRLLLDASKAQQVGGDAKTSRVDVVVPVSSGDLEGFLKLTNYGGVELVLSPDQQLLEEYLEKVKHPITDASI